MDFNPRILPNSIKEATSLDDVIRIINEKERADEPVSHLLQVKKQIQREIEIGSMFEFDPSVLEQPVPLPELGDAQDEGLSLETEIQLQSAAAQEARLPEGPGAYMMRTYRITGTVSNPELAEIVNNDGEAYMSGPRYCRAGAYQAQGHHIPAYRILVYYPTATPAPEDIATYDLPEPTTPTEHKMYDRMCRQYEEDGPLKWLQWACTQRLRTVIERRSQGAKTDLPVFTTPGSNSRAESEAVSAHVVTVMDGEAARQEAVTSRGTGQENLHYLGGHFSQCRAIEPMEGFRRADYRRYIGVGLTPQSLDRIARFLELTDYYHHGEDRPFVDGSGFGCVIERSPATILEDELAFGRIKAETRDETIHAPAEPVWLYAHCFRIGRAEEDLWMEDRQVRAGQPGQWNAKGMLANLKPEHIRRRLTFFEAYMETDGADARLVDYFQPAYRLLKRLMQSGRPFALLAEGDQIKVGELGQDGAVITIAATHVGSPAKQPRRMTLDEVQITAPAEITTYVGPNGEMREVPSYPSGAAHARGHESEAQRPEAPYTYPGSAQQLQFLATDGIKDIRQYMGRKVRELADLRTPADYAAVVDEHLRQERQRLDDEESAYRLDEEAGRETAQRNLHELKAEMLSGAVTLDGAGYETLARGEDLPMGHVCMLPSVHKRMSGLLASAFRRIVRSAGIYAPAYPHHNAPNKISQLQRVWGLGQVQVARFGENGVVEQQSYPSRPFEKTIVHTPDLVTGEENADDDGDATAGMAGVFALPSGRVVKISMHWRYPTVGPVSFCFWPASVATPWDPQDTEEARDFNEVIRAFRPEPDLAWIEDRTGEASLESAFEADLVARGRSTRVEPIGTAGGVKGKISAGKLIGPVNMNSAMQMITRKRNCNQAGPLTRKLERLADLRILARAKLEQDPESRTWYEVWRQMDKNLDHCSLQIERNLTGFKKDTNLNFAFIPVAFDRDDVPLPAEIPTSEEEVMAPTEWALVRYDELQKVRSVVTTGREKQGELSLENLGRIAGKDRITALLVNPVLQSEATELIRALRNVDTRLTPFWQQLRRTLNRAGELSEDDKRQVKTIQAAFRSWRVLWSDEMERYHERIEMTPPHLLEEMMDAEEERLGAFSTAMRAEMRRVGENASRLAIVKAIHDDWDGDWLWADQRRDRRTEAAPSSAPAVALIQGRVGEIFPVGARRVACAPEESRRAACYLRGQTLPGLPGERLDTGPVTFTSSGAVVTIGDQTYRLYSDQPLPSEGRFRGGLVKLRDARGLLHWA